MVQPISPIVKFGSPKPQPTFGSINLAKLSSYFIPAGTFMFGLAVGMCVTEKQLDVKA